MQSGIQQFVHMVLLVWHCRGHGNPVARLAAPRARAMQLCEAVHTVHGTCVRMQRAGRTILSYMIGTAFVLYMYALRAPVPVIRLDFHVQDKTAFFIACLPVVCRQTCMSYFLISVVLYKLDQCQDVVGMWLDMHICKCSDVI